MILDGILIWAYLLIAWIISFFPAYTGLPSGMQSAIDYVAGVSKGISCIYPTGTMGTQMTIILSTAAALLLVRFFAWLFKWHI